MKIKKVNIESFGGIKNRTLNFTDDFNLIYGHNEAGKSTIENFIKIWLYGMDNGRGKFNDRKRYSPLSGEIIKGELVVEHQGKSYIIKRTFGKTKKDDTCEILDEITGENIKLNNKNECGKDFFGINCATFNKTLFISQLGVKVDKDKEEEIMEKITNIYNSGDENTSVKKAVERVGKRKKQLVGTRKNGELDKSKEKRDLLKQEYFEGEKLGRENIENEESLIKKKELKEEIKEQIHKLDVYKKYLKKTKLQKDYKDISKYLIKGEELKKKQEEISSELNKGEEFITLSSLEEINSNCEKYLSLLDVRKEQEQKFLNIQYEYNSKKEEIKDYSIFTEMGENINSKLYKLKVEQKNAEDKLMEIVNIQNSISRSKREINDKSQDIGNLEFIEANRNTIEELVESYKDSLKSLKYKIENLKDIKYSRSAAHSKEKIIFVYICAAITLLGLTFGALKGNIFVCVSCIPTILILMKLYLKYSMDIKAYEAAKTNDEAMQTLKDEVEKYEEELNKYIHQTGCSDYEEFINKIKRYDKFKVYKEGVNISIKEKEQQIELSNIEILKENYNKNKRLISSLFNSLGCRSLEEIIEKAEEYEKAKKSLVKYEYELNSLNEEIKSIKEQMEDRNKEIINKCNIIGIETMEIVDLIIKIKEYKEKLKNINEVRSELKSVEETYKVLLKDRDINEIKEEMKEIISQDITYSYESEEEIDSEIRNKSNELLKVEKEIKDLEHLIEKRYIGKREISEIEEDILINEEQIVNLQKEYNALDLAERVIQESFDEVRKNIGPELNSNVINKFNILTSNQYEEAKISEDYKLKIRDKSVLFDSEILSNGAKDQLYLSLRLSIIEMLFKDKIVPLFLDDAFIQYDDERREKALKLLIEEKFKQVIFFTCQNIDKDILDKEGLDYNYIMM